MFPQDRLISLIDASHCFSYIRKCSLIHGLGEEESCFRKYCWSSSADDAREDRKAELMSWIKFWGRHEETFCWCCRDLSNKSNDGRREPLSCLFLARRVAVADLIVDSSAGESCDDDDDDGGGVGDELEIYDAQRTDLPTRASIANVAVKRLFHGGPLLFGHLTTRRDA